MRVVAVIQARMGSARLPGKVLADIDGLPMLWYVVHRAEQARCLDDLVVAVPETTEDEAIQEFCNAWDVPCVAVPHAGDVLGRYRRVAEVRRADVVVRLTADCPLLEPRLIDLVVWQGLRQGAVYSSNVFPERNFPDGLDVEVFPCSALQMMDTAVLDVTDREHVTPMLRRYAATSGRYAAILHDSPLGHLRWTVDTAEDLAFVREVYRRLRPRWDFSWQDVLALGEFAHRSAASV